MGNAFGRQIAVAALACSNLVFNNGVVMRRLEKAEDQDKTEANEIKHGHLAAGGNAGSFHLPYRYMTRLAGFHAPQRTRKTPAYARSRRSKRRISRKASA